MEQRYVELPEKIDATGTSNRKPPERICTARTPANIARVSELIWSQDDAPGTITNLLVKVNAKLLFLEAS